MTTEETILGLRQKLKQLDADYRNCCTIAGREAIKYAHQETSNDLTAAENMTKKFDGRGEAHCNIFKSALTASIERQVDIAFSEATIRLLQELIEKEQRKLGELKESVDPF